MSSISLDHKGIRIDGPEFNAIAPNLQSNILKSHSRDHAKLLFLQFTANKTTVANWVRGFISTERFVVSAMDQKTDSAAHKNGQKSKTVANFYLSASGYEALGFKAKQFTEGNMEDETDDDDEVETPPFSCGNFDFVRGMKSSKVNNKLKDPELNEWEQEYNTDIHAMVLLADDDAARLSFETDGIRNSLVGIATILKEETGNNLTGIFGGKKRNLEHFGYADGISQPSYFLDTELSYPLELQPLNIILVKDPFTDKHAASYGSFLVYRKLEQDVEGFNAKVSELAVNLELNANQQGKITKEDFAGALAVGRFKDGTPLVRSDVSLNEAPAFNNFMYEDTDKHGRQCPYHAHIRKSNPRGQGILVGERFITRRGIPYGAKDSAEKKGLLFMCFQSNLKRQFNFLQKAWCNKASFPVLKGHTGIDPLIGQGNDSGQNWPKQYNSTDEIKFDFSGFIKMMGGEYFFAPSIPFLKNIK